MILIINDNFDLLYFYSFYVAHASIGTALIDFMSLNQRRRNKSVLSVSHVLIWCQCAVRPNPHTQFLIPAKNKSNKTIKKQNAQFVSKSIARKTNFYWLEKTVGLCRLLDPIIQKSPRFFQCFFHALKRRTKWSEREVIDSYEHNRAKSASKPPKNLSKARI